MSIHVSGRRWFQKSYGNTYNTVTIHNGEESVNLPIEYGYGNYFLQRAQEWLGKNGFPELAEKYENGCNKVNFTIWLREHGGSYSVADVARQRDL
jgi:hypothetical protein